MARLGESRKRPGLGVSWVLHPTCGTDTKTVASGQKKNTPTESRGRRNYGTGKSGCLGQVPIRDQLLKSACSSLSRGSKYLKKMQNPNKKRKGRPPPMHWQFVKVKAGTICPSTANCCQERCSIVRPPHPSHFDFLSNLGCMHHSQNTKIIIQ